MLPREDPGANQPQHSCFSLHNPEKQTKATAAQREFGVGCAGHGQPVVPGMWGQRHHARVDGGDATGEEKQITKSFLSISSFPGHAEKSNEAGEGSRKRVL